MMEASIKSPAVQAAAAVGGFMAFLAEMGAEQDNEQQTKTRWALEYYAGKLPDGGKADASANGAGPAPRKKSATRTMPKVSRAQ